MGKTGTPSALMFRIGPRDTAPQFVWPFVQFIGHYRNLGYILLIREDDIRYADLDDTRQADEDRFKP